MGSFYCSAGHLFSFQQLLHRQHRSCSFNADRSVETPMGISHRITAEFLGTAFLLAAVVGSGIMGERLADGNAAVALLANSVATGAMLVVLIVSLEPISGAHF